MLCLQICQSVWSPQSVDMAIQEIFLPFLRVASLLKYHLFSVEFPKQMASINCKSKKYYSMVLNFAFVHFFGVFTKLLSP